VQRFRERVVDLLSRRGESQAWLAHQSGLSASVISRVLRGEREASPEVITSLAGVFGFDAAQLVLGTDAEARVGASADWVRRNDFEKLATKLAEYEARIHDLEDHVRHARESDARQAERRQQAETELCRAHLELQRTRSDLDEERAQRRTVERELRRYRHALAAAVARVTELQTQLAAVANEVRTTNRTSRLSALLSGVAAVAGVATLAHFLRREDEPEEGDDDGD
jgi:transcriptional regulator with XRE-family HTH domain